jgi:hypothetical protein
MILGCIGVKSKWPGKSEMNKQDLVESRVYSVFGYDHRLPSFWKQIGLRMPLSGRRIYVFGESIPWILRNKEASVYTQGGWFTAKEQP